SGLIIFPAICIRRMAAANAPAGSGSGRRGSSAGATACGPMPWHSASPPPSPAASQYPEEKRPRMRENPELPFPVGEYRQRLAKVQQGLAQRGMDACLISIPENIYYLTGFTSTGYYMYQTLILPVEGEPMFVTYLEEKINILRRSWMERYMTYSFDDPVAVTVQAIRDMGLEGKILGLEEGGYFFPIRTYKRLMEL